MPKFFSLLFLSLTFSFAQAGEVKIHVKLSPAGSFTAESSAVEVKGETKKAGAQLSAKSIELDLNSLKTGIGLRDRHMKEKYFETEKFPKAILSQASGKDGKFTGSLTVHGVTQPISGTYELSGGKFVGKFGTKISAYNISKPKYMGVGADDDVEVEVTLPEK
jgi:polyisoprenoid-binding protein YceI